MTALPSDDQFHEHIQGLSNAGIEFPRQGMVQIGGKMHMASGVTHGLDLGKEGRRGFEDSPWRSYATMDLPTEATMTTSTQHKFEATMSPTGGIERLRYATPAFVGGGLPALGSGEHRREVLIHRPGFDWEEDDDIVSHARSPEEFMDRVGQAMTEFDDRMRNRNPEEDKYSAGLQPDRPYRIRAGSHDVSFHDIQPRRIKIFSNEYDPNTRSLSNWNLEHDIAD